MFQNPKKRKETTKMLKGHVQIDLHNHRSGSNERIEQDNIITNAAQIMANAMVGRNKNMLNCMPLVKTLLGGILIFKDALTVSANNICFPGDNILIGYGGQILNTEDHQLGSLNVNETGPTEDGYETVWEFTTTQANGYISSLALTHNKVSDSIPHMAIAEDVLNFSSTTHAGMYRDISTGTMTYRRQDGKKCSRRVPTGNFLIDDTYNYSPSEVVLAESTSDTSIDGLDTYRYDVHVTGSLVSPNRDISNVTVSIVGGTSYIFDVTGFVPAVENYDNYPVSSIFVNNSRRVTVSDGIIYLVLTRGSSGSVGVLILNYGTKTANLIEIEDPEIYCVGGSEPILTPLKNGGCAVSVKRTSNNGQRMLIQVVPSGDYKLYSRILTNDSGYYPAVFYDDLTMLRSGGVLSLPAGYIGSIANLENPFEKVNTVSMKVKYRLTQV